MKLPLIGLGTWNLRSRECTATVRQALELGYRHIDTAHLYENHTAVQKGIDGFDRHALFITSKFALDQISPKKVSSSVKKTCEKALKELGTDYLDLYLIHWPDRTFPLTEIFQAVQVLVQEGKIHRAGVSNFTHHHLQDLLDAGCHPSANQVEFHPYLNQKELLQFCRARAIELIAYRPFGKGKIVDDPLFKEIGLRHQKTPGQVILRWLTQQNIPTIPKASSEKHLAENLAIFDFTLSPSEMVQIGTLHQNKRFCAEGDPEFDY